MIMVLVSSLRNDASNTSKRDRTGRKREGLSLPTAFPLVRSAFLEIPHESRFLSVLVLHVRARVEVLRLFL